MTQPASGNPPSSGPNAPDPASGPAPGAVSPLAVAIDALPKLLGIAPEVIEAHVNAGAPVARDGTVNLIHFAAWLNQRLYDSSNGQ